MKESEFATEMIKQSKRAIDLYKRIAEAKKKRNAKNVSK